MVKVSFRRAPIQYNAEMKVFSTNGAPKYGYSYLKKSDSGPFSPTICKINFQWCIDVNIKSKNRKMLEGNTGEYLWDLEVDKRYFRQNKKQ